MKESVFVVSVCCYEYTYPSAVFTEEALAVAAVRMFNTKNQDPKHPDSHYATYQKVPLDSWDGE